MSNDSRREFLLRFAAIALAGTAAGCETPGGRTEPSIPGRPEHYVVYGPPPDRERNVSVENFRAEAGDQVFFATDSAALSPEAKAVLERQAAWIRRHDGIVAVIEGHCDERGTREYNLALGNRRAQNVRDYLLKLGVPPKNLEAISFGKERPVALGSNEEAWAQNRRAVTSLRVR